MIASLYLLIFLLLYGGFSKPHLSALAQPLTQAPDWTSVRRSLVYSDTVYLSSCTKSCRLFAGMSTTYNSTTSCSCECSRYTPTFLPSAKSCVSRLDECWRQIRFETMDPYSGYIPTFTIPSTNNIFAPSSRIAWREAKVKFSPDGQVNCSVSSTFVQTDGLWSQKNGTDLFQMQVFNRTTFLKWVGNEADALSLEGSIVQLKLTCSKYGDSAYCLAFRIAGVHVNSNSLYHLAEREWNRIELIICFLLAILLILTIFGSVILWSVCWRMKKGKLIANIQTQFLFHLKQQQMYMEEQIAAVKANCARQVERNNEERLHPEYAPKRKLYFNAEFFEPDVMAHPPPVAQQFIVELRKMIDLAKERIRLKRHMPTLDSIKEEACEEEKYLEIPLPENTDKTKPEGSSPKSTKSSDSGVDSLSDEESRQQKVIEPMADQNSEPEKRPASRIPVVLPPKNGLTQRPHQSVQPTRYAAFEACKARSGVVSSPPLLPKPPHLKGAAKLASEPYSNTSIITEEVSEKSSSASSTSSTSSASSTTSTSTSSSAYSTPPDIGEIISNVPPPLPESPPPQLPANIRDRIKNGKRKTYAVFPSDSMLKKSLPRRIRRPAQLQQFLNLNAAELYETAQ